MNLHEQPIGQLACALPGATRIFHQHKLDFCCGGHVSLREAAAKRGVDLAALLKQLEPLQGGETQIRDWRSAPAAELIDYILRRYHERHREEIPELIRLARRVEHVHAARPDCPAGLADHLDAMFQELLSHMMKEEQVLFPMLLAGREAEAQKWRRRAEVAETALNERFAESDQLEVFEVYEHAPYDARDSDDAEAEAESESESEADAESEESVLEDPESEAAEPEEVLPGDADRTEEGGQ